MRKVTASVVDWCCETWTDLPVTAILGGFQNPPFLTKKWLSNVCACLVGGMVMFLTQLSVWIWWFGSGCGSKTPKMHCLPSKNASCVSCFDRK